MSDPWSGGEQQEPTQPVVPAWSAPPPGAFSDGPAGGSLPPYVEPPKQRRGFGQVTALAVGIVAIIGASIFAIATFTDDRKGAESPEDAVRALFNAIADEDVVGMAEALPAGERDALLSPIEDINEELKRLGIVDDSLDLNNVPGVEFEVTGLELETEELDEQVVAVRVTGGTISSTTVPDDVPIGETLDDIVDQTGGDTTVPEASDTADLADAGIEMVTVEDGDGWHVSLFYTIAEAARTAAGAELPDFGNGVAPKGAPTPEGALRNFVDAAAAIDIEGIIAVLPPDEMRALQDYAPLFLADAQAAADEVAEEGWEFAIDDLGVEKKGDGDTRVAQITTFALSGESPDGPFDVAFDGECFTVHVPDSVGLELPEGSGDSDQLCTEDLPESTSPEVSDFVDKLTEEAGFVVVDVDGEWYVSPVRTFFQTFVAALRALEREDIENFEDFMESMFSGVTVESSDSGGGPATTATTSTTVPGETTTTLPTETTITVPGETTTTTPGSTGGLQTPIPPDGLVADPEDCEGDAAQCAAYAQACYDGDMQACDDLYENSYFDTAYEDYGATCAGRLPENTDFCVDAIGPTAPN